MNGKLKSLVYRSFFIFKGLICIPRRKSEQEKVVLKQREKNCSKVMQVCGRDALAERRGA